MENKLISNFSVNSEVAFESYAHLTVYIVLLQKVTMLVIINVDIINR